jgi:hypothetical protein
MPTGTHLNETQKDRIYSGVYKGHADELIYEDVFDSDESLCTFSYLAKLCRWIRVASDDDIGIWIAGRRRTGNKSLHALDEEDISHTVENLALARPKRTQQMISQDLTIILGNEDPIGKSQQEISRWLKRHKISDHCLSYVSAHLDEGERAETLRMARDFATSNLHNFDETSTAYKKFIQRMARSHMGEIPNDIEWSIQGPDGRVYSVIADYTPEGWSIWRTFLCNIDHICVEDFLRNDLSKVLCEGDCVLHDGATIHTTQTTIDLLEDITQGRYIKVAAYSHDLSPVERGFANVWKYIHSNYKPSQQTPIDIINEAFSIYSVSGPLGYKGILFSY